MNAIVPVRITHVEPIASAQRTAVFGDHGRFNTASERIERTQFEAMSHAFRAHGGFVCTDEVAQRLRCLVDQPISRLARWIVSRSVISISWRAQTLMPAFQFQLAEMSIRPCIADVLGELRDVFDNWELALWFAAPNAWLDDAAPVTLMTHDALAVLQAARTDRFVACG
jgi:hypothetical protein